MSNLTYAKNRGSRQTHAASRGKKLTAMTASRLGRHRDWMTSLRSRDDVTSTQREAVDRVLVTARTVNNSLSLAHAPHVHANPFMSTAPDLGAIRLPGRTGLHKFRILHIPTRMWANAKRDGRPAEYRWRPLFNAAKFGWRPLLECRAVTLPRRESRWNLQGCPKLANRSQPLLAEVHHDDMWRGYRCLTSFFRLSIHASAPN